MMLTNYLINILIMIAIFVTAGMTKVVNDKICFKSLFIRLDMLIASNETTKMGKIGSK